MQSDADFLNPEFVALRCRYDAKRDVVDANYLASVDVDDLLVEQVFAEKQQAFVRIVGNEVVVG